MYHCMAFSEHARVWECCRKTTPLSKGDSMELLRGLRGLTITVVVAFVFIDMEGLYANPSRKFSTSALFHDSAHLCTQASLAIGAQTKPEKQQAALNIAAAVLKMAGNLAAKTKPPEQMVIIQKDLHFVQPAENQQSNSYKEDLLICLREIKQQEVTIDPDTVTLFEALIHFIIDLFDQENAIEYVQKQLSLLFQSLKDKLPGILEATPAEKENVSI